MLIAHRPKMLTPLSDEVDKTCNATADFDLILFLSLLSIRMMGSYRSKEDDVSRISTSIYVSNFPESFSAKDLFHSCKQYGHVVDTFIPSKRSKDGKSCGDASDMVEVPETVFEESLEQKETQSEDPFEFQKELNDNRNKSKSVSGQFKEELQKLDADIDKGIGSDDIPTYIDQQMDLECAISKEELDEGGVDCATDKISWSPDGILCWFYRQFWPSIKNDVFAAVSHFFTFGDIPNGCNSCFIALIPKVPDANMVKDFRPISLIGSIYKIIAKILANRLVGVLGDIVNEVQSAFITERQILDGPFILNEVIQWCKLKKKQSLIFKVDFEKAYDSVRWDFLDDVLKKFGFGNKWCAWIQSCLRSSRGSIIINGINLSPLVNLSHMFYADDAVFMGQWCDGNINTLVYVLECFFQASGLRINMCKSKIMGVNVGDEKIKSAASKLGCLNLNTPFSYLGTKVGGNRSWVQAWTELWGQIKVKSRLSNWKMKSLSIGGRLTLLKSLNSNKASWVKWKSVLASKEKRGLGVSRLYALNRASYDEMVWRYAKVSKVGSRSCWRNIVNEVRFLGNQGVKVLDYMRIKLGNRESTAFWDDNGFGRKVLKYSFPRIYALETVKEVSVNSKMSASKLENSLRHRIRGGDEQVQFNELYDMLQSVSLMPYSDRWVWSLEGSRKFFVASIRKIIDDNRLSTVDTKTLWNKCVPIKVNILAWKIKIEALLTRFNISRRGIDIDSILCPICECGVESARHVFFSCSLVRQIVRKVCSWWDIIHIDVNSYVEWVNWMNSLCLKSKSKLMIEGVFYVVWWHVWTFRTKLLFEDKKPLKAIIFDDVVSRSYYWCKFRCKVSFSWDDWLKNPNMISL
ncbi:RNA-directed DNA polymerase, eukaryota, reverse transcriptase zinc-binding domain protein [Tanacetum coccineum]